MQWFSRGTDTFLGKASDPSQLFLVDMCEDQLLLSVPKKAEEEPAELEAAGAAFPPVPRPRLPRHLLRLRRPLPASLPASTRPESPRASGPSRSSEPAAQAFKLNNPDCTVFSDDCNLLLTNAINGV